MCVVALLIEDIPGRKALLFLRIEESRHSDRISSLLVLVSLRNRDLNVVGLLAQVTNVVAHEVSLIGVNHKICLPPAD